MDVIVFFDAISGEMKLDTSYSKYHFKCDLTVLRTSSVEISEDVEVNSGDIWLIPGFNGVVLSGTVAGVNPSINSNHQKVDLYLGHESYATDILMLNNTLTPNLTIDNGQPYSVTLNGTVQVTGTDNLLGYDVIARQLMRAQHCQVTFSQTSALVKPYAGSEVIEFRLDDPDITDVEIVFANEQYNALTLYNIDDLTQSASYYLQADGSVSTMRDTSLVQLHKSRKCLDGEWNSLSYARSQIKSQSFNNEIEFNVTTGTTTDLVFSTHLLGQPVRVYDEILGYIDSVVSAFEIKQSNTIKLTIGFTRSRMSDQLIKEV